MANLEAWSLVPPSFPPSLPSAGEADIEGLFRARYLEMVRLAGLLGADDPEDIAQEAFVRLMNKRPRLDDPQAALPYLRAIVCNLTRNRHRHLRVVRRRTPAGVDEGSSEQAAILAEDHREVIAALAALPSRRREAIVLRFWLDLPEREIAAAMGVSPGTVKSHISRGLAALGVALKSLKALEDQA
jgi:RNA polymerase sigma-70 factor (sigma-E family)